jgi:cytochrome c biogenesis protein CcmG, thiol:disulfide interchange protein DsbE
MENLNEDNTANWVDGQIQELHPKADWQPSSHRAFARVQQRERASKTRRRICFSTLSMIGIVAVVLGFPSMRIRLYEVWQGIPTAEVGRDTVSSFSLENIAGGRMTTTDLKGKVAVVDLWATWCGPCLEEIPRFNQLNEAYRDKDVAVIGIAVESPYGDIRSKAKQFNMKYTVLVGNDDAVAAFGGLRGFPTTFVMNKDGRIYKSYMGVSRNKQESIKHDIETLLAEDRSSVD